MVIMLSGCSLAEGPDNLEPALQLNPAQDISRTSAILSVGIDKRGITNYNSIRFILTSEDGTVINTDWQPVSGAEIKSRIGNLEPGTIYQYQAEAITQTANARTSSLSFETIPIGLPIIGNTTILSSGPTSLILSFEIEDEAGGEVSAIGCELKDVTSGTVEMVYGEESGPFTGQQIIPLTQLTSGRTYSIRPFAENKAGKGFGDLITYETRNIFWVETPGDLAELISQSPIPPVRLEIGGNLNGDDFREIRRLFSDSANTLSELDISDVRICEGGGTYDGLRYTYADIISTGLFSGLSRLKVVNLPLTGRKIMVNSFQNCVSLEKVTIPASVEEIAGMAFNGVALQEIRIFRATPPKVSENSFLLVQGKIWELCILYVPGNSIDRYKEDSVWGQFKEIQPL